jgi:hypothetical protein
MGIANGKGDQGSSYGSSSTGAGSKPLGLLHSLLLFQGAGELHWTKLCGYHFLTDDCVLIRRSNRARLDAAAREQHQRPQQAGVSPTTALYHVIVSLFR